MELDQSAPAARFRALWSSSSGRGARAPGALPDDDDGRALPDDDESLATSLTLEYARDFLPVDRQPNSPISSPARLPHGRPDAAGPLEEAGQRALGHLRAPLTCPMQPILGDAGAGATPVSPRSPTAMPFLSSCAFCHTDGDSRIGERVGATSLLAASPLAGTGGVALIVTSHAGFGASTRWRR